MAAVRRFRQPIRQRAKLVRDRRRVALLFIHESPCFPRVGPRDAGGKVNAPAPARFA